MEDKEKFEKITANILVRGFLIFTILIIIYDIVKGNILPHEFLAVIVRLVPIVCINLLITPKFEKHGFWIKVWMYVSVAFSLIFIL